MAMQCTMTGGSPWGFKMTGGKDFRLPLAIAKVTSGGKASKAGVVVGYIIDKVNGEDCSNLSHHEAQNRIKSSGSTLVLSLSKPKPRETPSNTMSTATSNIRSKSPEYKPDPARIERYNNPGKWQKEGQVTQSPALYSKTFAARREPPASFSDTNGDKPVTVSPEIQQMIEEEEARKNQAKEAKANNVNDTKPWEAPQEIPQQRSISPPSPVSNVSAPDSNKSKAASNIGKFFQSSSAAPRYGEPSFTKPLLDVSKPLGDPAVLEVRIGPSLPVPTVHWYHNNKPTKESKEKDIRMLNNGPVHTLLVGELTPDLLGTYTCTIMNKYGSKSCRCLVTVEGEQGRHHSQSSYGRAAVQPTTITTNNGRKVTASSNRGLYSNKSAQDSYQGRLSRKTSRSDSTTSEESEVLKALREEAPQKNPYKTPTMKFLQDSLLAEAEDLPESEDL